MAPKGSGGVVPPKSKPASGRMRYRMLIPSDWEVDWCNPTTLDMRPRRNSWGCSRKRATCTTFVTTARAVPIRTLEERFRLVQDHSKAVLRFPTTRATRDDAESEQPGKDVVGLHESPRAGRWNGRCLAYLCPRKTQPELAPVSDCTSTGSAIGTSPSARVSLPSECVPRSDLPKIGCAPDWHESTSSTPHLAHRGCMDDADHATNVGT